MKTLLTVIASLLAAFGFASVAEYTFEQTPSGYAALTNPIQIHGQGVDDAISPLIDIGFSFLYDGIYYTQFRASTNGFITFNPSISPAPYNLLNTHTLVIGALWDDLATTYNDSSVSYKLTGTAPDLVLTVQFQNLNWYFGASPQNLVNFQIRLREGSNRVEFVYGLLGNAPGASASASIGISGAVSGDFISVTPAAPQATYSTTQEFTGINGSHVPYLFGHQYSFVPPPALEHDLAALEVTGNVTPSEGVETVHQVRIQNVGSQSQNGYTVSLFNGNGDELGFSAGVPIAPGEEVQIPVVWTPAVFGPMTIYGKVFLNGDENPANDQTPDLNLTVLPAGPVWSGIVGSGHETARVPVDMYWKNSLFECLIYPAELENFTGRFTGLRFYNNFTNSLTDKPVLVWMGTTAFPDLADGWIPSTELTLVFSGLVDFPSGENIITLPFSQPFDYFNRSNLVILAQRPMDSEYYSSSDYFRTQTWGVNRARKVQSDSTVYDPANPPANATVSGEFPQTGFVWAYVPVGILQGSVSGTGNQPLQGATLQVLDTGYSSSTDANGNYAIHLPVGTYDLMISADGYVAQTVYGVIINLDQTTVQDFALSLVDSSDPLVPPASTALLGISPNPFKTSASIAFSLKQPAPARLEVFNSRGQKVRTLVDEIRSGGLHEVVWDGRDEQEKPVSAGIYLLKLNSEKLLFNQRMILLK
ncbi:MAG: carboxypeptidase regulatory-like domain-containing protein [Candidatus Syntrophosphaera sp.]|nr:carboxypeptidase regulatory-like domain-containing protein [Candidatus Syntrophosphaera sp.]